MKRYARSRPAEFTEEDVNDFRSICAQKTFIEVYPLAFDVQQNIPIFESSALLQSIKNNGPDQAMDELHHCLSTGPGVFVIKNMVSPSIVNRANTALEGIIEEEKRAGGGKGDHFAEKGANDRIWNSFEKHAMIDPAGFADYYANDVLALVCEAWLGPGYQITAQTNIVKPGGKPQQPHRDYHLGFQSPETTSLFPLPSQTASQLLTLQLAIAHSAMPLESGPTELLPFSHHYAPGYLAYRRAEFAQVFKDNYVQLPLEIGDGLFFNPALFHAAGENFTSGKTGLNRSANLMQVSACWSRPMEIVARDRILRTVWGEIGRVKEQRGPVESLLKAIAEGYSFPTNLDKDPPPADEHCPPSQLDMARKGLKEGWTNEQLGMALDEYAERHRA